MNSFANFISTYRNENKISENEFVDIVKSKCNRINGIDSSTISMWEKNNISPSIKKICQVIIALELDSSVLDILSTFNLPNNNRLRNTLDRVITRKVGSIPLQHQAMPASWFSDEGKGRYLEKLIDMSNFGELNKEIKIEIMRLSTNDIDSAVIIYSKFKTDIYIHYINYSNINTFQHCLVKLCDLLESSNCDYLLVHSIDQTMMDIMMLIRGSMPQRKTVMDKFFVISRIALILNEIDLSPHPSLQFRAML